MGALLLITVGAALTVLRADDGELLPTLPVALPNEVPGSVPTATPRMAEAPTTASGSLKTAAESDASHPPDEPDVPALLEAPDALDERIAAALDHLMTHDRVYRVDDLTLGLLALKLAVPEYRLRRFINLRLGHRNFNAYVNGLRLAKARAALADPAHRTLSVLEIAMAAGFASIGPFNRAFKATSGVTPSEFRRRALAES